MTPPASFASSTFTPDKLIAGEQPLASRKVTLVSGENRTRGALLGRIAGTIAAPAAGAGNTGNGTFAATPTAAAGLKEGQYRLVCIEPGTNVGQFVLEDPDGNVVGKVTVAAAYSGGHLAFTLQDGSTDFVAGDFFTVDVAVGTKYKLSLAAATDGSHRPFAILAESQDASGGDKEALIYERGDFAEGVITFGTGHTADSVRAALRALGITLVKTQGV